MQTDVMGGTAAYLVAGETNEFFAEAPAEYNAYFEAQGFSGSHGYHQLVVTVPVEAGDYKVTLGKCMYAYSDDYTMAYVKNAGQEVLASVKQNTTSAEEGGVCYHQDPTNNVVTMEFTVAEAQMVTILCAHYTPYIKFEKVPVDNGPIAETWFANTSWQQEFESTATWDAEAQKITVNIAVDKNSQWQGQVKINTIAEEAGKWYHFGIKMKANHNVAGVTIKWEDNTGSVMEVVALEENTEFVLDRPQFAAAGAGNGILVLDFGQAKAGDVIEVYDIVTEEVAAPVVDLEDGYYVIGLNGWTIYDLTAADKFAANEGAEGEYVITKTLAAGNEFKVVAVAANALGAWYPAEAGNYMVDNAHAGEKAIYFRPNYDGGEGWHAACIYVAPNEEPASPIQSTWFANANWGEEHESTIVWDPETDKITITVAVDKNAQWQGQVKLFTPTAEAGKCYNVTFKLKANNAVTGITFKWQDNNNDPNLIYENQTIALEAGAEYTYESVVEGIPGNGIAVFDFGFAKAGDVIEIYDFAITETDCEAYEPQFYLVGNMTNWAVVAEERYHFAPNEAATQTIEYKLNTTLAEGDEFKVVGVIDGEQIWYPDGMGNNYVVDAAHAGNVNIYFRFMGDGGEGWHYGYILVEKAEGIDNIDADAKAVKFIENGQIVIFKNGVKYTVQGQVIK